MVVRVHGVDVVWVRFPAARPKGSVISLTNKTGYIIMLKPERAFQYLSTQWSILKNLRKESQEKFASQISAYIRLNLQVFPGFLRAGDC